MQNLDSQVNLQDFDLTLFVRSSSSRLPSKYKANLNNEYTLLSLIYNRCSNFFEPSFAIPYNDIDSELHTYLKSISSSSSFYFGSNDNLIKRAFGSLVYNSKKWLIRYTCDDPFKDFDHLSLLINHCATLDHNKSYLVTSEYPDSSIPYGLGWELYSLGALRSLAQYDWDHYSAEHITPAYLSLGLQVVKYDDFRSSQAPAFSGQAEYCSYSFSIDCPSDLDNIRDLPSHFLFPSALSTVSLFQSYFSQNNENIFSSTPNPTHQKKSEFPAKFKNKSRFSSAAKNYFDNVLSTNLSSTASTKYTEIIESIFTHKTHAFGSIALANGTATLITALKALGIGEGDEVIVSPLTMSSPSIAVMCCGAIPVWADINPSTLLITKDSIQSVVTDKTKAVIFVSLYGSFDGIIDISEFCKNNQISLIEDNAESDFPRVNNAPYKLFGDFASYSFQSSKNYTCGEGGILACRTKQLWINSLQHSCLGYVRNDDGSRIAKATIQTVGSVRHNKIGENYRMSEILSSVIYSQLEDEGFLLDSRRNSALLQQSIILSFSQLRSIDFDYSNYSAWGFPIIFETEEQSRSFVSLYNSGLDRNCYPAWRLAPEEPAFDPSINSEQIQFLLRAGFDRYVHLFANCRDQIANAFKLRPRLVGLRTNHWSKRSLDRDLCKLSTILREVVN